MALFAKAAAGAANFLLGGAAKLIFGGDSKPPAPLPEATRDTARDEALRDDRLRRRRGGAADILTGSTGAEAAVAPGKFVLGS